MNLSQFSDEATAHTDPDCAQQRAVYLSVLGARTVLELCVGPSLETLTQAYSSCEIAVTGNDIEERWRSRFPRGNWVIRDALDVDPRDFDAVVFAPPLSVGCSGTRDDSLAIEAVEPSYERFLLSCMFWGFEGIGVLVLPSRSLSTPEDRKQLHRLMASVPAPYEICPLYAGQRRIRKYVDVYFGLPE